MDEPAHLLAKYESVALDPNPSSWYDLWHTHVDWRSEGDRSPKKRQVFLQVLFTLFRRLASQARQRTACQVWLLVYPANSGQDAVFVHTPNPNHDNFPFSFEHVTWSITVPSLLAHWIDLEEEEVGESRFEGEQVYWVRKKLS